MGGYVEKIECERLLEQRLLLNLALFAAFWNLEVHKSYYCLLISSLLILDTMYCYRSCDIDRLLTISIHDIIISLLSRLALASQFILREILVCTREVILEKHLNRWLTFIPSAIYKAKECFSQLIAQ